MNDLDNDVSYVTACGEMAPQDAEKFGPVSRDIYILHYVTDGKGYVDLGNKHTPVKKGQSFLIRPSVLAKYYPDPTDPWGYVWVDFRGSEFEGMLNKINFRKNGCLIDNTDPNYVLKYIRIICDEFRIGKSNYFCAGLLKAILGYYADIYPATKEDLHAQRFIDATTLIAKNYSDALFTTKNVCEQLNISTATLYRLFIEFAGTSPKRYLNNYRILMSKNLIDADTPITTVSFMCGFNDPLYFSRVFKATFGQSPSAYKKQSKTRDYGQENYLVDKRTENP